MKRKRRRKGRLRRRKRRRRRRTSRWKSLQGTRCGLLLGLRPGKCSSTSSNFKALKSSHPQKRKKEIIPTKKLVKANRSADLIAPNENL